jgi:hypothetical protein
MRPRKHLLPLTIESLAALMIPGKPYTAAKLSCIFDGSPASIIEVLTTLESGGRITSAAADCGRKRDLRLERRIYWIPLYTRVEIAARRIGPAEVSGELKNYDLTSLQRLAMTSRHSSAA